MTAPLEGSLTRQAVLRRAEGSRDTPVGQGYVYVLTNEAMPGYVKIGLTRQNEVASRIRELDTTSVPLPFELYFAARVPDCARLERTLFFVFGDRRARARREFFRVDPALVKAIIELVAIEDIALSDAEQSIAPEQREDIDAERRRREVRTFTSMGITLGSVLTFAKDPTITCDVVSARRVAFQGEELSPSAAALKVVRALGYDWRSISRMDHWCVKVRPVSERDGSGDDPG